MSNEDNDGIEDRIQEEEKDDDDEEEEEEEQKMKLFAQLCLDIPYSKLSSEQQAFVDLVRRRVRGLKATPDPEERKRLTRPIALLASAGAGKSFLIQFLAQYNKVAHFESSQNKEAASSSESTSSATVSETESHRKQRAIDALYRELSHPDDPTPNMQIHVAVTSTTGLSAVNLEVPGACTVHSKLKLANFSSTSRNVKLVSDRILQSIFHNKAKREELAMIDILVIDEVSMLNAQQMDLIGKILAKFAQHTLVVLSGDFHQLPPIGFSRDTGEEQQPFYAFESKFWRRVRHHRLTTNFRQCDDVEWQRLLERCRKRKLWPADYHTLNQRTVRSIEEAISLARNSNLTDKEPAAIFATNENVDRFNMDRLRRLDETTSLIFERKVRVAQHIAARMASKDRNVSILVSEKKKAIVSMLKRRRIVAASESSLGKNGRNEDDIDLVNEFLRSSRTPQRLEIRVGAQVMLTQNLNVLGGLVNGLRGIVRATIPKQKAVKIFFPSLQEEHVLSPKIYTIENADGLVLAELEQIPLAYAWAMTVHKVQGMTLHSGIYIDIKEFCPHMMYVALSRVPSIEHVFLRQPITQPPWMDERVLQFDMTLSTTLA